MRPMKTNEFACWGRPLYGGPIFIFCPILTKPHKLCIMVGTDWFTVIK